MEMETTKFKRIVKIGKSAGLKDDRLYVFIEYILRRFPNYEEDYWEQWATKFAIGRELRSSDDEGRTVIGDIAKDYARAIDRIEQQWQKAFS